MVGKTVRKTCKEVMDVIIRGVFVAVTKTTIVVWIDVFEIRDGYSQGGS